MEDLKGKVVAVTGGASGIGLATVQRLHSLGARIVVGDLAPEPSQSLHDLIADPDRLLYVQLDVSSRTSASEFMKTVIRTFGRIDGLVNNAGICPNEGDIAGDDIFDKVIAVNLKGVWNLGTEALRHMVEQGSGAIVNTASDAALKGIKGLAAYTASKHGVLGLTRTWCKDWTPSGVRVNAVAPGKSRTPLALLPKVASMSITISLLLIERFKASRTRQWWQALLQTMRPALTIPSPGSPISRWGGLESRQRLPTSFAFS